MLNISDLSTCLIVVGCAAASLAIPAVRRALHARLSQIHYFFVAEEEQSPSTSAPVVHVADNWNYDMYSEES
jgi:hypothetical protein